MSDEGYHTNLFINSALVSMYGKCGSLIDAQTTFDGVQNVVSCNTMLSVYVDKGYGAKALELFRKMQDEGVGWDEMTFVSVLQGCIRTGSLGMVRQIHAMLGSAGNDMTPWLANILMTAYGRCSSMAECETVFNAMPQPDVVSWNALMASYARQGDFAASLLCYDRMMAAGVNPDGVTFLSVLSVCSHAGLVDEGVEYFESMTKDHGIAPGSEHYVSMVDLFARAGCFTRVQDLLSTMPMQPDLAMWLCLLGACQKHGEVQLGEQAFKCAVRLEPAHAAAYAMMWNIYADAGLLERAAEVKKLKQQGEAWKQPGQSWMEHEQQVHTFLVGDQNHLQHGQNLYDMLSKASSTVWDEGCEIDGVQVQATAI